MIGAIIGDIIGSTHEYDDRIKTKDFELFPEGSTFTDDTVLTIAVADSLLNNIPYVESFYKWVSKYPDRGYGQQFFQWVISKDKKPYGSKGNGAAMRVSPISWLFNTEKDVLEEAKRSAELTHNSKEGIESAQAVAMAIFMARNDKSKDKIKKYVSDNFGFDLDRKLDDIRDSYIHSMMAMDSVPESIICFLESDSYEDAIRNAISLGGDADTMGCIAGSIAQAFYSVDKKDIWNTGEKFIPKEMYEIYRDFLVEYIMSNITIDFGGGDFTDEELEDIIKSKEPSKDPVLDGEIKEGDVAYLPNVISEEDLPYKYVFYPGHYGAYFAFSPERDSIPYFCSCAKESIEMYISARILKGIPLSSKPTRAFILDSMYFPMTVVEDLLSQGVPQDKTIINELKFKDNLCHVCNKKIPKYEYCHKMYGGKFKRMYGWYINVEKFKLGIDPVWDVKKITINDYPSEVKELLEEMSCTEKPLNYWQLREGGYSEQERKYREEASKKFSKLSRKLSKYFENIVRLKLGYKKVGEGWVTETSLFYMIKNILPESKVIHHYRPPELDGLELDIFIKDLNIGVEYQGIQHYKPVKHWGGQKALEENKKRDRKKASLCKKNDIKLIYFKYSDKLTEEFVKSELESAIS